jgi:hypothetical protein
MIQTLQIFRLILTPCLFFALASPGFSQWSIPSVENPDPSSSLEDLIHQVHKENLKLWEFVKTQHDETPERKDTLQAQKPPSNPQRRAKKSRERPPSKAKIEVTPVSRRQKRHRQKAKSKEKKSMRQGQRPYPESSHPPIQLVPELPPPPPRSHRVHRASTGKRYKLWDFSIGVRNVTDNNPDGFRHDTEIYHRISRKLPSRHKVFLEYKTVALKGEGAGFFTKTSIGFQQFYKRLDSGALYNPYLAFILDHWTGDLETYQGIAIAKKKASTDHFTTRFGFEYSLTKATNLDFFFEDGGGHLDFVDANGSTIEVHARNKLYGFGILHDF